MKIAISTQGDDLNAEVDPHFGRCARFVLLDTETDHYETIENPGSLSDSGAGIQAAMTIIDKGVESVLTGNIGPKAHQTLSAAGIVMYTGLSGPVLKCVNRFQQNALESTNAPSVQTHHGVSAAPRIPTPQTPETIRVAVAAEADQGLEGPVSAHFGRAPYYMIVNTTGTEITSCSSVANPFYSEHGIPGRVPAFVNDQGVNVIIAGGMGARAVTFFDQYGIEAVTGAQGTVGESVFRYINGELKGTVSCKHTTCHDDNGES